MEAKDTQNLINSDNTVNTEKHNITDAEWKVMQILWQHSESSNGLSLGCIQQNLKDICSWNVNTVRTLLVRLAEKKTIGIDKKDRTHKYYPLVNQDKCVIQETESLLTKIFGGSTSLMFSALIKNGKVSKKEQEEILDLIHSMRSDGDA